LHWRLRDPKANKKEIKVVNWHAMVRDAAITHINERGEPVSYLELHTAAISALAKGQAFYATQSPGDNISHISLTMEDSLSTNEAFTRFGGSEKSLEVGKWWLCETSDTNPPLSDRVERAVVNHLLKQPPATLLEIDTVICQQFPGLLTPNAELLHVCLSSYGQQRPTEDGKWYLRPGDLPEIRRNDIEDISELISRIGKTLGYHVEGERPMLWRSLDEQVHYAFYIIASAIISDIVFSQEYQPEASLLVLPGGRANLMAYKLANDSRLKSAIGQGWRFMKFRLARWMGENPVLNPVAFEEHISKETLTYESPQLQLL
ncbi:MAG: hypothetical protein PVF74_11485, partial [Anaerolineales bacterium]